MKTFESYPTELKKRETEAIAHRRSLADIEPVAGEKTGAMALCFSGGGIRSATFCLGFTQAMARRSQLSRVDFLSTVSGGGYIGAFIGRFYDRLRTVKPPLKPSAVETALANSSSAPIRWLRNHGKYLAPSGKNDLANDAAIYLRNFLTLHFVVGLLLFGLYGLANGIRYTILDRIGGILPYIGGLSWMDMPVGHLVNSAHLGVYWSPWFMLVEAFTLFFALPRALGYWLASQDKTESFSPPALLIYFALAGGLLAASVTDGVKLYLVLAAVPFMVSFLTVEIAWYRVRQSNAAVGTGGIRVEQLRARTYLTHDLALYLGVTLTFLYLAVIDTLGHAIYEAYTAHNIVFAAAMAQLGGGLLAVFPVLRATSQLVSEKSSQRPTPGSLLRLVRRPAISGLLALLLIALPLLVISYVSHACYRGGDDTALLRGWGITLATLLLSVVLATKWAMPLINRTSLQATYAARIARAFLGASNPRGGDENLDEVMPGDDVDSLCDYKPHEAGGPIHIINSTINQTIDKDTLRNVSDRMGACMACSSIGISISRFFHAVWDDGTTGPIIKAISHAPGTPHPLLDANDIPTHAFDDLPLRDWIAISGAAVGVGMGQDSNPALSILFLLTNVRTGYWWNSGLSATDRGTRPDVSFTRRLLWLLPKLFPTQSRLFAEGLLQFSGPWGQWWYLSDGGHFENLAGYEMIRRRVPFMIIIDSGADPDYRFEDFANFQRKIRIDFQAELEPFGQTEWTNQTSAAVATISPAFWAGVAHRVAVEPGQGGPFDPLPASSGVLNPVRTLGKHAMLFRVRYAHSDQTSLVLYVKASLDGDEPADVIQYHSDHPDFPHESTAEQFFDESQWESYRCLGQHVGDEILGPVGHAEMWLAKLH